MSYRRRRVGVCAWVIGVSLISAVISSGQTPDETAEAALARLGKRNVGTHDPSTIVRCGKEYWFFGTGHGIASYRSTDLQHWQAGPPVFAAPPEWARGVNGKFKDFVWAPDVIRVGDRYLIYYSVSSFGSRNSAIGMASTPTLDPDDPAYRWTDHGVIVQTTDASDHNAIDASLMLDRDGRLWMAYGSFWSGIKLIELDAKTGLRLPSAPVHAVAYSTQIESPTLFEHGGWYYLIVNWGWCCRGIRSTYELRVGRSRSPAGPFVDRHGKDLLHGGGDLLLANDSPFIGPGHAGVLVEAGRSIMSMHFYDGTRNGAPTLAIRELTYSADGWPVVGEGAK